MEQEIKQEIRQDNLDSIKSVADLHENIRYKICKNSDAEDLLNKWITNNHLSVVLGEAIVNDFFGDPKVVADVITALCDSNNRNIKKVMI